MNAKTLNIKKSDHSPKLKELKSRRLKLVHSLILVIVLFLITLYSIHNWHKLIRIATMNPNWLLFLMTVLTTSLLGRAYFLKELVQTIGKDISFRECFCLTAATDMFSILTLAPSGGAYRAYYLRRLYNIDIIVFVSGTALFIFVSILTWCVCGIIGLIFCNFKVQITFDPLLFISAAAILSLAALWKSELIIQLISHRRIAYLIRQMPKVTASKQLIAKVFLTVLLITSISIVSYCYLLQYLSISIDTLECMAIISFHHLAGAISLTPSGIGFQEASGAIVASGLGIDETEIVLVFVLIRLGRVFLSFIVGAPCWWLLHVVDRSYNPNLS